MSKCLLITIFLFNNAFAGILYNKIERTKQNNEHIIINSITSQLDWETPRKVPPSIKPNKPKLNPKPTPSPTAKTKGELLIEKIKAKNRQKIKELHKKESERKSEEKSLKSKTRNTYRNWRNQIDQTRKIRSEKKKEFNKNIQLYKKSTFDINKFIELSSEASPNLNNNKANNSMSENNQNIKSFNGDFYVIKNSLEIPIRDQKQRPTCAAFAGVRAIEVLLASHGNYVDISEQYFYWLSRPNCQTNPCSKRGSWVYNAFNSKGKKSYIPLENSCPYDPKISTNNDTHVPLKYQCNLGKVRVNSFTQLKNLTQVQSELLKGKPIVAGFKLNSRFYKNNGMVGVQFGDKSLKLDSHAKGHAVLIIGRISLPKKYHQIEGQYCLVTANSWGQGWGMGGHACLTEKWIKNHSINNAFMALESIEI